MTTDEAVAAYGTKRALAKALNIWPSAITQWGERPPRLRQYELQTLSAGALIADEINHGNR